MNRIGKTPTLATTATVLFPVLSFAPVAYPGWTETTAQTQQTLDLTELK